MNPLKARQACENLTEIVILLSLTELAQDILVRTLT